MITAALLTTGALLTIQPQISCVSVASAAEVGQTMKLLKPAKLHVKASGPSKVLEIVWTDATGQLLDQQGEWIQLRMEKNGRTGWIHQSYLKAVSMPATTREASPPAVSPSAPPTSEVVQPLNGPQLKLRRASKLHAEASGSSRAIEKVEKNEVVTWLDKQDVWVRVAVNSTGHPGWIHQSDLAPASMAVATPAETVATPAATSSAPGTASTPEAVASEATAPDTIAIDTGMAATDPATATAPAMDMGNWQPPARTPHKSSYWGLAMWGVGSVVILAALFWLLQMRRRKADAAVASSEEAKQAS
ncbi:hypothetical protein FEF65_06200 [Mariprofundus erugo]|uniref:SH3b domain-containing protein n=1 Tax=Mariprofundus erugo TaxID=2528639 RepID=A0A5R9GPF8_9PROT|nr:hypothetical protein FEF65_06200 [Mariprofundus erugo]